MQKAITADDDDAPQKRGDSVLGQIESAWFWWMSELEIGGIGGKWHHREWFAWQCSFWIYHYYHYHSLNVIFAVTLPRPTDCLSVNVLINDAPSFSSLNICWCAPWAQIKIGESWSVVSAAVCCRLLLLLLRQREKTDRRRLQHWAHWAHCREPVNWPFRWPADSLLIQPIDWLPYLDGRRRQTLLLLLIIHSNACFAFSFSLSLSLLLDVHWRMKPILVKSFHFQITKNGPI